MSNEGDKILFLCFHGAGSMVKERFKFSNGLIVRRCQLPCQFTKLRTGAYDTSADTPLKQYPIKLMKNILEGGPGECECFASKNPIKQEYHDLEMLFDESIDDIGAYEFTLDGGIYYFRKLNIPRMIMKLSDLEDLNYSQIIKWFLKVKVGDNEYEYVPPIKHSNTDEILRQNEIFLKKKGILCLIGCSPMSNSEETPGNIETIKNYYDDPPLEPKWNKSGGILTSQFFTTNYLRTPALKKIVELWNKTLVSGQIGRKILMRQNAVLNDEHEQECKILTRFHQQFVDNEVRNFFKNYLTARSHGLFNEDRIKEVKIWKPGNHYQSHFNLHYSYDGIEDECLNGINTSKIPSPLNKSLTRTITLNGDILENGIKNRRNTEKPSDILTDTELLYSIMEPTDFCECREGGKSRKKTKRKKKKKKKKTKKKTKRRKTKRKTNKGRNTKRR